MTVQEAFNEHIQALGKGWDAVMEGYSEDIVLLTPEATVRGKAAAQEFIAQFFDTLPKDWLSMLEVHKMEIVGDFVYVVWSVRPHLPLAVDTFLYRDGLIITQSFAPVATSAG